MSAERAKAISAIRAASEARALAVSVIEIVPVEGLPEFGEGMAVGEEIAARAELRDGDVVVISQKVVSKAEGRMRPSPLGDPRRRGPPPRRRPRQGPGAWSS